MTAPAGPPAPLSKLRAFIRARFSREGAVGLYMTAGFFACVLLVLLFGALADSVFDEKRLEDLDRRATLAVRGRHAPGLGRLVRGITFFGGHAFVLTATLAVCGVLALRRRRVSAILFAASVLGGFTLNSLLKLTYARARPTLWEALVSERTYSFPSGHAAMATVFFGGLAAVVFHVTPRPLPRLLAILGAAASVVAVAASRVYLGAHWVTDVAAGVLVGLFWVFVAAIGTEFFARRADMTRAEIKPF